MIASPSPSVWNPFPGVWDWVDRSAADLPSPTWPGSTGSAARPKSVTIVGDAGRGRAAGPASSVRSLRDRRPAAGSATADWVGGGRVGDRDAGDRRRRARSDKGLRGARPAPPARYVGATREAIAVWTYSDTIARPALPGGAARLPVERLGPARHGSRLWTAVDCPASAAGCFADNPGLPAPGDSPRRGSTTRRPGRTRCRRVLGLARRRPGARWWTPPPAGWCRTSTAAATSGWSRGRRPDAHDHGAARDGSLLLRGRGPRPGHRAAGVAAGPGSTCAPPTGPAASSGEDPPGGRTCCSGWPADGRERCSTRTTAGCWPVRRGEKVLAVDDRYALVARRRRTVDRARVGRQGPLDPAGRREGGRALTPYAAVLTGDKPSRRGRGPAHRPGVGGLADRPTCSRSGRRHGRRRGPGDRLRPVRGERRRIATCGRRPGRTGGGPGPGRTVAHRTSRTAADRASRRDRHRVRAASHARPAGAPSTGCPRLAGHEQCRRVLVRALLPIGPGHDRVPAGHRRGRRRRRRPGRPPVPHRRAGGADRADRRGDARHRALPAPGPPGPAAVDHRRPGGLAERPVRRAGPAAQREHRGRRGAADVPGHRHRDRDGQARPARAHRRRATRRRSRAGSTTRTPG